MESKEGLSETRAIKWEIHSTKEYDLFELIPCNRPIYPGHLRRLTNAIKRDNRLHRHPIRVRPDGKILDGQHRMLAAKELNVTLYYYIDEDPTSVEDIAIEGLLRKRWTLADALNKNVVEGRSHYILLKQFMDRHPWMSVSVAVAVTRGANSNSYIKSKAKEDFIWGEFKITDMTFATRFADAIGDFMGYVTFGKDKKFMQTVCYLLRHPDYDHDAMMAQMKRTGHILTRQYTKEDYLRVFEKIYNYRKQEKTRVRFF